MASRLIFSIIVPPEDNLLARVIDKELKGVEAEIIREEWEAGLLQAEGKFVCFMESGSTFEPGFFFKNLFIYLSQPAFGKLAMVSSKVHMGNDEDIFGYRHKNGLEPLYKPSSKNTHSTQIGYIGGAIIRKEAIEKLKIDWDCNPLHVSADLSLQLWECGFIVQLNPNSLYTSVFKPPKEVDTIKVSDELQTLWNREAIGGLAR